MHEFITKFITEQVLTRVADEGVIGIKEVTCKFAGNYVKRRNVGYGVIGSAIGGFNETKNYYCAMLTGEDFQESIPAISFEK